MAGYVEKGAGGGDGGDLEALAGEPLGDGSDLVEGGAELVADLGWGEPLVVGGGGWVLQVGEELVKGGLKGGGAGEEESEVDGGGIGGGAGVGGGCGPRGDVAGEAGLGGEIGMGGDAAVGLRREREDAQE